MKIPESTTIAVISDVSRTETTDPVLSSCLHQNSAPITAPPVAAAALPVATTCMARFKSQSGFVILALRQILCIEQTESADHDPHPGHFPIFPQRMRKTPVSLHQNSRRNSRRVPQHPQKSIFPQNSRHCGNLARRRAHLIPPEIARVPSAGPIHHRPNQNCSSATGSNAPTATLRHNRASSPVRMSQ